jgi:hypothetical protein
LGQISDASPQKRSKVGSTSSEFRKTSQQLRENGKSIIHEVPISQRQSKLSLNDCGSTLQPIVKREEFQGLSVITCQNDE